MESNRNTIPYFSMKVRKRLVELDMTQRQLAKDIGVNENYLTDILRGRRSGEKYRQAIIEKLDIETIFKSN
ncbi:HTH domain-containing protein [Gottschalkia acidurici 9a]|uniref:HTH domain-containing protein n=1 Tax=Gottschalkia acidurici (strain ATCC 7906 / DSM 604 / BCRC 14475 / CIP 104303 / KCTC 5404 / NCIMB 10678 / 9a) TaxID=1128398 RepID=K0B3W0_GOTA9|nr:helix-turn-helix transcriptional regulator [Gottschalkia acidurici]AFS79595.1 HTH domain-containing protein [Gottschalkia acidurici 9a]